MKLLEKKIKSLFNVNYNKSAKSCNPCMNACKKVDKKINGRELSKVSNKEMKKLINFFPFDQQIVFTFSVPIIYSSKYIVAH